MEAFAVSTRRSAAVRDVRVLGPRPGVAGLCTGGCRRDAANSGLVQWSIITAGFALAIAAAGAALGQGRAVASAAEAIARNPGAAGEIRGALILGLVLIESLVIYVLLVSLILFFIKPFGG